MRFATNSSGLSQLHFRLKIAPVFLRFNELTRMCCNHPLLSELQEVAHDLARGFRFSLHFDMELGGVDLQDSVGTKMQEE